MHPLKKTLTLWWSRGRETAAVLLVGGKEPGLAGCPRGVSGLPSVWGPGPVGGCLGRGGGEISQGFPLLCAPLFFLQWARFGHLCF